MDYIRNKEGEVYEVADLKDPSSTRRVITREGKSVKIGLPNWWLLSAIEWTYITKDQFECLWNIANDQDKVPH